MEKTLDLSEYGTEKTAKTRCSACPPLPVVAHEDVSPLSSEYGTAQTFTVRCCASLYLRTKA